MSFKKLSPHFKTKSFKLKSRFPLFWENSERRDHSSSVGPYGHPSPHSPRRPGLQGCHSAVSPLVPFYLLCATQSVLPDCGLQAGWGPVAPRGGEFRAPFLSEHQLTSRAGAPGHAALQITTNRLFPSEGSNNSGRIFLFALCQPLSADVCWSFTWIWSPAYFSWKHGPHRLYTCPPRFFSLKVQGNLCIKFKYYFGIGSMGGAFASEVMQSPLGLSPPIHPLLKCPSSSPWEWIFHTVLLHMDLSHVVRQGFKGETTKRAGKASEAPGTKPREAPKNFILCTF